MTARTVAIIEMFRSGFASMERLDPHEVDAIVSSVTSHLRAIRPEQMSTLSALDAPTEPNVDPRGAERQYRELVEDLDKGRR